MSPTAPDVVLALRRVRKEYDPHVILRDVSLDVRPGVTLLTGVNGAGKSTLMRIMAGLEKPTSGEVLNSSESPPAYLGHATCLYAGLTALENLRFWDRAYGGDASPTRLREALLRVNLARRAEDCAGTFSRGMAQRLNLARILLRSTDIWLLDEPDTGLDVASTELLLREIAVARDSGKAILWISHRVDAHRGLADCLVHIEDGRIQTTSNAAVDLEKVAGFENVAGVGSC